MKTISKISAVVFAIIISGSSAANVLAIATTENNDESSQNQITTMARTEKNACSKITVLSTASSATVAAHVANMKTDFANRLTQVASNQSEVDQKLATDRAARSDKFDAKITELKDQDNLTDIQIVAIDDYATKMKAAEVVRQTAVDLTRLTYRNALSAVIADHQKTLTDAATKFETSVGAAFTTAKTTCTGGTEISGLKNSIRDARQTLVTARQSTEFKASIKSLQTTRDTAIKAANDAFKQLANDYKTALLASLNS